MESAGQPVSDPELQETTVLQTVSRQYWESLPLSEKNATLRKGPIHVVGMANAPPHGIRGLSDPKLKSGLSSAVAVTGGVDAPSVYARDIRATKHSASG